MLTFQRWWRQDSSQDSPRSVVELMTSHQCIDMGGFDTAVEAAEPRADLVVRRERGTRAARLDVPLVQAAQNIVPVAVTSAESVERLRSWASGRCLCADKPGIYKFDAGNGKTRRKIPRGASLN
jgi:hypothetical protein